jgi:hypothetical protein
MSSFPDTPGDSRQRLSREYEDPHYHDDDEVAQVEDGEPHGSRPAVTNKRKPPRLPAPPRRFEDD